LLSVRLVVTFEKNTPHPPEVPGNSQSSSQFGAALTKYYHLRISKPAACPPTNSSVSLCAQLDSNPHEHAAWLLIFGRAVGIGELESGQCENVI
jgi:hypothetical protein